MIVCGLQFYKTQTTKEFPHRGNKTSKDWFIAFVILLSICLCICVYMCVYGFILNRQIKPPPVF